MQFLLAASDEPAGIVLSNLQFGYDPRSVIVGQQVLGPGTLQLTLQGIPNLAYTLERAQTVSGSWTNIGITFVGTNGLGTYTDSNAPLATLFYRAVASAPNIMSQVQIQTNVIGNTVTFAPNINGTPTFNYQWLQDGVFITGATNGTLTLTNLSTNDAGSYSIIVSNSHGSVESAVASLTVLVPPTITKQPLSWAKETGTSVIFSAAAIGQPPLSYQWRKDGIALLDGANVAGTTTPTLTLTNLQSANAGAYDLVVMNPAGSVPSSLANLWIMPFIQSVQVTGVTATATSELASYGRLAANAVNGIYHDGFFWESVGFDYGYGPDGAPAITFDLVGFYSLANFVIWNGHEPGRAVRRMDVQASVDGVNFTSLGETMLSIGENPPPALTNLMNGVLARYVRFAILENWAGVSFPTSDPWPGNAMVAINEVEFYGGPAPGAPFIAIQPTNSVTNLLGTAAALRVTATGTPPLSYQWWNAVGPLVHATNRTLVFSPLTAGDAGEYFVIVTNAGGAITSKAASITVKTNFTTLPALGLLAYYPFNGNANDASGNGRHGVVEGAILTSNRLGQADSAYAVTGANYIRVEGLDPDDYAQGFSFGGWVRKESYGGSLVYWMADGGWGSSFLLFDSGFNAVHYRSGSGNPASDHFATGLSLAQNHWQHIFVTHGATKDRLYVGGQLIKETTAYPLAGNVSTLNIGWGSAWSAVVDDMAVYGRELAASEVGDVYSATPAIPAPPSIPQIITQPQPQTNFVHTTASFSALAVGAGQLDYQWRKDGTNLISSVNISGATSVILSVANVQLSDAGVYDVVITNNHGSVTSQWATLVVKTNNLQLGLLAYYPFNGDATDASGNGRHGIVESATLTSNRLGQANSAYAVTGAKYIRVEGFDPDNYALGFSFGGWVRMDSYGGSLVYWVDNGSWGSTFILLDSGFDTVRYRCGSGNPGSHQAASGLSLAQNQWQHIFITHGATKDRLYVGGQLIRESTAYPLANNSSTLRVGWGGAWSAVVDDISVYGRELTTSEVGDLYNLPP